MTRIALFGGLYSNYLALTAALQLVQQRGIDAVYCLGDLGAFGPYPDRVFPILLEHGVTCIAGNYDESVGQGLSDCQCGYLDARDNYFARLSYDYTLANTSAKNRDWLRGLPRTQRFSLGPYRVLLCHGSPRRVNEFLWESTTSTAFLVWLAEQYQADVICATHSGIKWSRRLGPASWFVNVGVLGRPENDGHTHVWCTVLEHQPGQELVVDFVPVVYDHERLADEMRREQLPAEFIQTIRTGWWTSCLEILPEKERRSGRF